MSESVFESFEAYLKGADYPKERKIMQAAVDLISTKSYNGTSTYKLPNMRDLAKQRFKYFKTKEDY